MFVLAGFFSPTTLKWSPQSLVIANELQDSIAQVIREDIAREAEQSSSISILAEKSTDISLTQMLVVYISRLISSTDFKPVTHFLTNVHVLDGKAATVTGAILKEMEERKIPVIKVTGFGSDGASAISNVKERVAGKLKRLNPSNYNKYTLHCTQTATLCFSICRESKVLKRVSRSVNKYVLPFQKICLVK